MMLTGSLWVRLGGSKLENIGKSLKKSPDSVSSHVVAAQPPKGPPTGTHPRTLASLLQGRTPDSVCSKSVVDRGLRFQGCRLRISKL